MYSSVSVKKEEKTKKKPIGLQHLIALKNLSYITLRYFTCLHLVKKPGIFFEYNSKFLYAMLWEIVYR